MADDLPIPLTVLGYPSRPENAIPRRVQGIQLLAQWKNDTGHGARGTGETQSPEPSSPRPDQWLRNLVGSLFQSFVTMALPGAPAAEMLPHTAQLWVDVLLDMNLIEADAERIQAAGRKLLRTLEEWPQVKALIQEMPGRKQGLGTGDRGTVTAHPEPTEADRQAGKEVLKKLRDMF